jgi:hypothetical protein
MLTKIIEREGGMSMAEPVLRWPGSEWRLLDWIISHMPPHEV